MFDSYASPLLVVALEMMLVGISIAWLHNLFLRYRFRIRKLPTRLGPIVRGTFILIYFTTPTSFLCKTVQGPAIEKLRNMIGDDLQVLIIDANEESELANLYGVRIVPTTFLINPYGELSHVNQGVARAEKLLMQMHGIGIGN